MKKTILLFSLILFSSSVHADAFKLNQVNRLYSKIGLDIKNINQMSSALPATDTDSSIVGSFLAVGSDVKSNLNLFGDLGYLYNNMTNQHDKLIVSSMITIEKRSFKNKCNSNIRFVNQSLALTRSVALVSAAQKLSQHINEACDLIGR